MSPSDGDLGVLLAVVTGWMVFIFRLFPNLKTPAVPRGIFNLQFAFTTKHATAVVDDWRVRDHIKAARRSLLTDVAFVVTYVTALVIVAVLVNHAADAGHVGPGVVVALLAGVLDLIENAGLAWQLRDDDRQAQPVPLLTSLAATGKLLLLLAFVALLFAAVLG